MRSVCTCLWFDNNAQHAVALYKRVFGGKVSAR